MSNATEKTQAQTEQIQQAEQAQPSFWQRAGNFCSAAAMPVLKAIGVVGVIGGAAGAGYYYGKKHSSNIADHTPVM